MKPGTTINAASTTTTSTAASVPVGAAAAEKVKFVGNTYGHCATPQPRMMLATATMASKRAPRDAWRTNRTRATNPHTTERMTSARAREARPSKR
jgi:hypothetical protein